MLQQNTITGWVVKGLGGAANMVAALSSDKVLIDNQQLKDFRAIVVQLASHYNFHAKRSSMEESERPPFWGPDYPVGGMCSDGGLEPTQPVAQVADSSQPAGDDPTDADNRPT